MSKRRKRRNGTHIATAHAAVRAAVAQQPAAQAERCGPARRGRRHFRYGRAY
ncbi:hypothetical protein [Streptomyces sp. TRM68367]|uniref:hypothetical protein n=1 Tax=Streptomyces sp. TRM68367 TaxID=2758415 RepID=UPI00165BD4F2|nr:hypothetical protein [Streptomyces sp. TRM68367]MBC9731548.1 hypothetical protein [Streptomyces sp. TRM68367]